MIALPTAWPRRAALPRVVLKGPRVVLSPPSLRDWKDWIAVRGRDIDHLQPFEPLWPADCLSRDFFRRRLMRQVDDWNQNIARYFLIRRMDTGALIGGINLNNIVLGAAYHASLGYWIAADHEGEGYMGEALDCALSYGFGDMELQRIHASCVPENARSARLLERAGFTQEGFAKEYLQINGAWRDHRLFALTRAQYYARPAAKDRLTGSTPSAAKALPH